MNNEIDEKREMKFKTMNDINQRRSEGGPEVPVTPPL